jgi:glutamate-5-semialdehyde dehydrogenase
MTQISSYCESLARRAKTASRVLATTAGNAKNHWLHLVANALPGQTHEILASNAQDVEEAAQSGISSASLDRLRLTPGRLQGFAASVRAVADLPEPIGRVLERRKRPNDLEISKVSVPLGTILFIYESRPNVTVDAATLCVKSGNAIILRGGKEALRSNTALVSILRKCLVEAGLPADAVQIVETTDRDVVGCLLGLDGLIDLAIPRGGEGLIRRVAAEARMPVLKHYKGNCHVYVDRNADLEMAERIIVNAKCQRPGVCNAAESLLVHKDLAAAFLPRLVVVLQQRGVEIRGCEKSRQIVPEITPATDEDYAAEYLDLIVSLRVVNDLDEAVAHINHFGSQHTDAIVTADQDAAQRFAAGVDASAVMINASTRFNDGHEFGLGAEIGISTDKFHARGPCGLLELTSYKYIVYGTGQVR